MWKKILLRILDGERNISSPFTKDGVMDFVFVVVDEVSRMGFMRIWCSKTLKGILISRMKIPEGVDSVSADEFANLRLPQIELVDPSKNGRGL